MFELENLGIGLSWDIFILNKYGAFHIEKYAWQDAESCLKLKKHLEKYIRREIHGRHL